MHSTFSRREGYAPTGTPDDFVLRLIRPHIEERLKLHLIHDHDAALDIGCGGQPFRTFIETLGAGYFSFDVQQNQKNSVDFLGKLDGPLPKDLVGKTFSLVLCTEVMEHVADWDQAFKNLTSLLSKGGVLLMTCPFFYPPHEEPWDYWRPTRHAFSHYGLKNGLNTVEVVPLGTAWDVLGLVLGHTTVTSEKSRNVFFLKAVSFCKTSLYRLLLQERIQNKVSLQGPFFVSHVITLKRPA